MEGISNPSYLNANISGPFLKFTIAVMVLQSFFISLHILARLLKRSSDGPETWFVLSGYFFTMAFNVTGIFQVKIGGLGRHIIPVLIQSPQELVNDLKIMIALNYTYLLAVTLPRLGVLCIYLRIFKTHHCPKLIYLLFVILIANLVTWMLVVTFACRPFAFNWDKSIPDGYCVNEELAYEVSGIPNIITDVVMLVMPLPFIWRLQATKARKIGLMVTFWTGSIGTICAVLRTAGFFKAGMFEDLTYNAVRPVAYSVAEAATYLMAAIFLTLGPLLRDVRRKASSLQSRFQSSTSESISSNDDRGAVQVFGERKGHITVKHDVVLSYTSDPKSKSFPSVVEQEV